jgi:O-antigen/teichoic acid export membrane protein
MLCFIGAGAARFMAFAVYFLVVERRGTLRPHLPTLRGQLRFGLPLFLDNLVGKLNRYLDRLFIGVVFSAEVFAVYHIAAQELPLVGMLPYSLTSAILPRLVLLYRDEQYAEFVELWHASMVKMAIIMLPIAVFFFVEAGDFLTVAFTEGYAGGALVFRLYLFLLPLRLCSYGGVVQSTGATKLVLYATLTALGVNMALNWPLLKLLGMPGPAVASVLAQVVAVLFMLGAIRAKVNLSWARVFPFAAVARAGAVAVVAGLPIVLLDLGGLSPGQRLGVAAAIYLPCYLFAGLLTRTITGADLRYLVDLARPGKKEDRGSDGRSK